MIYVYNGSYTENVNVNKQLTLHGEGADVVSVTNSTANAHVFWVTVDYVNISGFNVTGATGSLKAGFYLNNNRQHCNISNNNALDNYYGIYLFSSSNNTLTSNNVSNNSQHGIYLRFSSSNTLTSNNASNNNYGFYLRSSSNNNTLTSNNANSNTNDGINLESSSNNTLTSNNANSNINYGFYLKSSSSNNTLTSNNASNNTNCGICLLSSSNNTIYNNYFNNTKNADDDGVNIWNTTRNTVTNIIGGHWLGGNYWSDYAGSDTVDSDGLGDTLIPYNSSGSIDNGGDYHPLVDTPPTITISSPLEGQSYNTSTVSFNVTADETIDTWLYNINGTANVTFTPNTTLPSLLDGIHNVTVYANDSAGNIGSALVNFSIDTTPPTAPTIDVPTDDSSGPVNYPTPLPENVVNNEVKGTIFNEPVSSADLKFTKGYITLVTVDAKGTISEVMVTIQKFVGKPAEIKVAPPSSVVHTYYNIKLGRIGNDDLEGATIKFKAEKKWIAENGGDRNVVVVMRYHDGWEALETKPISEDDEYVFFSARTPGFSTFAITMELEEEQVVPVEAETPEPVVEEVVVDEVVPEPEEETSYWWLVLVMIAIVVVSVVFFVYKNKKDESEK